MFFSRTSLGLVTWTKMTCRKTCIQLTNTTTLLSYLQLTNKSQDVEYVDPMDDDQFPGIKEVKWEFQSWEWTFGKTPNFSIHRRFHNTIGVDEMNVEIKTNIIKGCIDHLQFDLLASVEIDPQVVVSLRVGLQEVRMESTDIMSMLTQIKMDWIANGQYTVKTSQVLDWLLLCILETLCL